MAIFWKKGSTFKTDPSAANEVMQELAKTDGGLTPTRLVEASRPENAPLHNEFEWNDKIAAEKWREQRANIMIDSIVIVPDDKPQQEPVRVYFNIERGTRQFLPTAVIMSDEEKKTKLLDVAKRELASFKAKYSTLCELSGVITAIDVFLENGETRA